MRQETWRGQVLSCDVYLDLMQQQGVGPLQVHGIPGTPVGDLFPPGNAVFGDGNRSSIRPIRAGELRSHSAILMLACHDIYPYAFQAECCHVMAEGPLRDALERLGASSFPALWSLLPPKDPARRNNWSDPKVTQKWLWRVSAQVTRKGYPKRSKVTHKLLKTLFLDTFDPFLSTRALTPQSHFWVTFGSL